MKKPKKGTTEGGDRTKLHIIKRQGCWYVWTPQHRGWIRVGTSYQHVPAVAKAAWEGAIDLSALSDEWSIPFDVHNYFSDRLSERMREKERQEKQAKKEAAAERVRTIQATLLRFAVARTPMEPPGLEPI